MSSNIGQSADYPRRRDVHAAADRRSSDDVAKDVQMRMLQSLTNNNVNDSDNCNTISEHIHEHSGNSHPEDVSTTTGISSSPDTAVPSYYTCPEDTPCGSTAKSDSSVAAPEEDGQMEALSDVGEELLHKADEKSPLCRKCSSMFLCSLSRQELLIFCTIFFVNLTSQMCLSIMAPFFPIEAAYKGVSHSVSGWIFGVFALTQFFSALIVGKILPYIGPRIMICSGQIFSGVFTLVFGFLDGIVDKDLFVALCLVLRILLAFGCSACETSSFALIVSVFPLRMATVLGSLETAIGLGMMVGPALGGLLYEAGGYPLPFIVLGTTMMLTAPLMWYSLSNRKEDLPNDVTSVSLWQLLRIPSVAVVCLAVFVAALVWSLFDPILAPHLEKFGVSAAILGLLFLLVSASYAIFSPIWGSIADRLVDCSPMLILGFIALAISLLFLGPTPWLGFGDKDNYIWLNILSMIGLGMSESLTIVPTYNKILGSIVEAGFEDSFAMHSMVSGIWGSCYALGDFVGPVLGGFLTDKQGFPRCLSYVAVICLVMSAIVLLLWLWERKFCCKSNGNEEHSHVPYGDDVTCDCDKVGVIGNSLPVTSEREPADTEALLHRHTMVTQYSGSNFMPRTQVYRVN